MELTLHQIAAICAGEIINTNADDPHQIVVDGATIDSREVRPGQLFVPLIAARDGHDFIAAAADGGAAATLLSRTDLQSLPIPGVVVADTAAALRALGQWAAGTLKQRGVTIVGITGSVGKTTVKDLAVAAMVSKHAHANVRSFNNELGVPLTLLATPAEASVVVLEMGARGIGHVAELCAIAPPDVGAITTVGAVHTSEFGSIDGVVAAKGELVEALDRDGIAVLNAEVPAVLSMRDRTSARVCTFGTGGDVWATDIVVGDDLRPSFVACYHDERVPVSLTVAGLHQVTNALGALAIAIACGVSLADGAAGLAQTLLSPWRMEMHRSATGGVVINDAYNANSLSMKAALDALAALDAETKIAVLGTMAELGERHNADHGDVAAYAQSLGVRVIAYAEPAYDVEPKDRAETLDEALALIGPVDASMAVLVKASRVAGLERLASRLAQD